MLNSDKPEFLALYGRRRIGKTYLVREFFKNQEVIVFNVTGAKNAPLKEQLAHFIQQIGMVFYAGAELKVDKTWDAAFEKLTKAFTLVSGQKIINNKGGLHNRITEKIALDPFSLKDTEQFLIQSGIKLNRSQILLIYTQSD
jgi:AAA+ ATPase superfamily predicted ATPase